MKRFQKIFLESLSDRAVFAFGRLNPPTIGHEKLIQKLMLEGGESHFLFVSRGKKKIQYDEYGYNKDPLTYEQKIEFMRLMFPGVNIVEEPPLNSPFLIIDWLINTENFRDIGMVAGSDRINEFQSSLDPFVKQTVDDLGEEINFEMISSGERDPDASGSKGMSASKARRAVQLDDFDTFSSGIPNLSVSNKLKLFHAVKAGMGPRMIKVKNRWRVADEV